MDRIEKKVTSLGPKFVPTVRRHDNAKKYSDFMDFCRKLRLAVFFYNLRKQTTVITPENNPENENNQRNQHKNPYYDDSEPWTKNSNFNPFPGQNEALEEFILELENYLFDPSNTRKVRDNQTEMNGNA